MSLEVVTWNVKEQLGDPYSRDQVLEQVLGSVSDGASVVVLNEVCRERPIPIDEVRGHLSGFAAQEGFDMRWADYDDDEPKTGVLEGYGQHMAVLSRGAGEPGRIVRLSTRNAIAAVVEYGGVRFDITGAHFDDRSEGLRVAQAKSYIGQVSGADVNVLAGDLNSMGADGARAYFVKSLGRLAGLIPEDPDELARTNALERVKYKLKRTQSLVSRMSEMANGATLGTLETAGFHDADPRHRPTHLAGQLDHIMYAGGYVMPNFELGAKNPSDHRMIKAEFEL